MWCWRPSQIGPHQVTYEVVVPALLEERRCAAAITFSTITSYFKWPLELNAALIDSVETIDTTMLVVLGQSRADIPVFGRLGQNHCENSQNLIRLCIKYLYLPYNEKGYCSCSIITTPEGLARARAAVELEVGSLW